MSFPTLLIRWLCDPARQEELAGDLEELRNRGRAPSRLALDLASVCLRQSRARAWTRKQWMTGSLLAATTVIAGTASGGANLPEGPYTISARDAAGAFTLKLARGQVVEATVNERPFPLSRVVQTGSRFRLLGAGVGASPDLEITLTRTGGIAWEGRPAPRTAQPAPIDLSVAAEYVAELAAASAADDGKLWGRPLYGPLLLVDPGSRFVAANRSDPAGLLSAADGLFIGSWPAQENIANTAVSWGGARWTMLRWPLPSDRYARQRLAFHELFHRIQPELGLRSADPANAHLATRDGRTWTRLEWRALAEALIRPGAERRQHIADALTFRARRRSLFPAAAAEERALELNEGLAEYTGLTLSGLPRSVLADRAAVELANREQQEALARSFAYASGPAYGILLDERGVAWRQRVTPETDLSELLRAAYGLEPNPSGHGAEERGLRYGGRRVIAQESALAVRTAAREAQARARLVDGPTVSFPVGSRFQYSFNPNEATPLAELGTVYESARITDEWGILTVSSGGVLLLRAAAGIVGVTVPAPAGATVPPVNGDGWKLELDPAWEIVAAKRPGSWELRRR